MAQQPAIHFNKKITPGIQLSVAAYICVYHLPRSQFLKMFHKERITFSYLEHTETSLATVKYMSNNFVTCMSRFQNWNAKATRATDNRKGDKQKKPHNQGKNYLQTMMTATCNITSMLLLLRSTAFSPTQIQEDLNIFIRHSCKNNYITNQIQQKLGNKGAGSNRIEHIYD